jgi:uncharacterized membrane protein YhaH (DUF805 family)
MSSDAMAAGAATVPLDQPLRGASFGQAVSRFFRKYATFSGRASLSEYWWWALATFLVYVILGGGTFVVGLMTGELNDAGDEFLLGPIASVGIGLLLLWFFATLVPQLALAVRRLHDANITGWAVLVRLLPSLGDTILFVLTILPPNPAGERFDKR